MVPGLLVVLAFAGDEASAPDLVFTADPATLLRWAEAEYATGDAEDATRALLEIKRRATVGEAVPVGVLDDALIQLGEIQYNAGDLTGATASFEWLLERHPEASVNPYHHDAKLVQWFEFAREGLQKRQKPVQKRRRYPWWGYAPFGVPQIGQGRVGSGVGFAVAQGLLVSASIASFYEMQRFQGPWWDVHQLSRNSDLADSLRHDRILYGINVPATLGFYGLWVASVAVGGRSWSRDHAVMVTVQLSRDEIGFGVVGALP